MPLLLAKYLFLYFTRWIWGARILFEIQSSKNDKSKILFLHFYETGFFNLGQRIQ